MPIDHQVLPRQHVERDSEHETVKTWLDTSSFLPVQVKPVQAVLYGPGETVVGADLLRGPRSLSRTSRRRPLDGPLRRALSRP